MWQKIIAGIVVLLLAAPGMVQAIDDTATPKQIDRARLSHSFRNTGTQGGLYDPGSQAYGGRASGSMHYPFVFTGDQDRGFGRDLDSDNSRGEGVWLLAKDASGRVRITASGPVFITEDVEAIVPELTPGGNLMMISGDHPFVKAKLGYETKDSNAWHMADGGAPPQMRPVGPEPIEISNYRENGDYTEPAFDHFPEEIIINKWKSDESGDGTGLTATRFAYGWSHPDFDDFIIVELTVENTSSQDYDEVYVGWHAWYSINKPGHVYRKWNGWDWGEPGRKVEDDHYQYTEAANYTGKYAGWNVSYQYDADSPNSGENDRGEPRFPALATSVIGYRGEGELYSFQYVGWGPVDLVPPFINDPDSDQYVPITGTSFGGPDLPDGQPKYSKWWKRRGRTEIEFEPNNQTDTAQDMWDKIIQPGKPIDDNPVEGGPKVDERIFQEQNHSHMYGPWQLNMGQKGKIVVVFAAGMGAENAGPGGEPMDPRLWAMSSGAQAQATNGEDVLFNHIARARQLYAMGYDLPNQPPDVATLQRTDTDRPLLLASNANGNVAMTWHDGTDDARHPDFTGGEASDILGYRIYSATALGAFEPVPHSGNASGPWHLVTDIAVKDPAYYSGGTYSFADVNSVTGFTYWYNVVPYGKGHSTWENKNAQNAWEAPAQQPVPTTLADLPDIVQKHVKEGVAAMHTLDAARHDNGGRGFNPVIAASDNFDALESTVLVVPNPWKDDGIHSFGNMGDNNQRMRFTNLPRLAKISIYTAGGDLVVRLVHDGTRLAQHTAEVNWGQRTRSGTSYAPAGVFFFAVESLVPGHEGKVQTGSFVVIK